MCWWFYWFDFISYFSTIHYFWIAQTNRSITLNNENMCILLFIILLIFINFSFPNISFTIIFVIFILLLLLIFFFFFFFFHNSLVVGAIKGQYEELIAKVNELNAKSGPFGMFLFHFFFFLYSCLLKQFILQIQRNYKQQTNKQISRNR